MTNKEQLDYYLQEKARAEKARCNCVIVNREEGESEREWFKRWMCMFHWMQTDYYRAKLIKEGERT